MCMMQLLRPTISLLRCGRGRGAWPGLGDAPLRGGSSGTDPQLALHYSQSDVVMLLIVGLGMSAKVAFGVIHGVIPV
jgi:hypothetical protein